MTNKTIREAVEEKRLYIGCREHRDCEGKLPRTDETVLI
jgi:hypothetical protein